MVMSKDKNHSLLDTYELSIPTKQYWFDIKVYNWVKIGIKYENVGLMLLNLMSMDVPLKLIITILFKSRQGCALVAPGRVM